MSVSLSGEGIKNLHAGLREIAGIARGDGQAVRQSRSGDEAVLVTSKDALAERQELC
jgi:hypothetical protein